jgi:NAD(P)-dependent dehydrogenase (short-subunit alcohol dehydrogenase family)
MVDALNALPSLQSVRGLHDLHGRVALVTGAASGLGRAMAWGLACHGADVAIVDRDAKLADACAKEIAEGTGCRAIAATADVSNERERNRP